MANLIRAIFGIFWLAATGFLGLLVYVVLQTEGDPRMLWAWLTLSALSFISATFLAYNIIFGHHDRHTHPRHHA